MVVISDLEVEGINGEAARKSGRPSPSRGISMRIGIILIIGFTFKVAMKTGMIPENRFLVSGRENVTLEGSYRNVSRVQPGGIGGLKSVLVTIRGFFEALFISFYGTLLLELFDKTFFIAAILAMRRARLVVYAGAITALGLMTLMSTVFGHSATIIPNENKYFLLNFISSILFCVVGSKMLKDGYRMSPGEGHEELEEVESQDPPVVNEGDSHPSCLRSRSIVSLIFLQAFTMTFLSEWGDRSQIATRVLLAFGEDVTGVCIGALLAHCFCTGLAVDGGRRVAAKTSKRIVRIIGGVVFYTLALTSMFKFVEFNMISELQRLRKDDIPSYDRSSNNLSIQIQFPPRG